MDELLVLRISCSSASFREAVRPSLYIARDKGLGSENLIAVQARASCSCAMRSDQAMHMAGY